MLNNDDQEESEIDRVGDIWLTFVTITLFGTVAIWIGISFMLANNPAPLPHWALALTISVPLAMTLSVFQLVRKLVKLFWIVLIGIGRFQW